MIAPAVSTMTSAAASKRSLVVTVNGRKIANTSVFHTQSHLASAGSVNSAPCSVNQLHTSRNSISAWRKVKVGFAFLSISSQPPKAAAKAISETGTLVMMPKPIFWGARIST